MCTRLLAGLLLLLAVGGCDPMGSGPLFEPDSFTLTPWNWVSGGVAIEGPRSFELRMKAGEDRLFVGRVARADFTHVTWTVGGFDGQASMEFLGFACVPASSCGVEGIVRNSDGQQVARLQIQAATQVMARVAARTPGRSMVGLVGSKKTPCPNQ